MKKQKDKASLEILFININPRPNWTKDVTMLYFPIGLCTIISAAKRNGFKYDVLDLMVEPKSEDELKKCIGRKEYDVVAFGSLLHAYWIIKPMAAMVKSICPNALVVVGNYAATLLQEKLLSWTRADIAVIGEGDKAFVEILERLISGRGFEGIQGIIYKDKDRLIRGEKRHPLANLDDAEFPIWETLDVESYINSGKNLKSHHFFKDISKLRAFPIITAKGCPFRCTFCTNNQYSMHNPYRQHSVRYIVSMMKELQARFKVNHFRFADELSFDNLKKLESLADAIINEHIDALFEIIIRVGLFKKKDQALADKLRKAGVVMISYALESANSEILKAMDKRIKIEQFSEQKAVLDKAGIISGTNIVIGYPQETEESIAETFQFCYDNDIMPGVCFLLPAPGCSMYDYAVEKGFIKDEEQYIVNIGEQQFINLNMTKISNNRLRELTIYNLKRIRDKLGLDIPDANLICSVVLNKDKEKVKVG